MIIKRAFEPIDDAIVPGKVLVIYGPHRVGKTFLLMNFIRTTGLKYKLASGDDIDTRRILSSESFKEISGYLEGYELLAIDEAQNIPNIDKGLKIIVDQLPGIRIIATGSSSFEMSGRIGEPLTGRKRTFVLYPIAQTEMLSLCNRFDLMEKMSDFMIFGAYPEVVTASTRDEKIAVITEIAGSYLLKDLLAMDRRKNARSLHDLLKLLAFQVGQEVSLNQLAASLSLDVKTVQRYLDLLEKTFVVIRLGGFARNPRYEATSKAKYYFMDNGIRNALIASFNAIDMRNDADALRENFIFMERLKWITYGRSIVNRYFWRTYDRQEIDLVEESEGRLHGFEMKWSARKSLSAPRLWQKAYSEADFR
jgi:predicted AAA+ superfamily ATPase